MVIFELCQAMFGPGGKTRKSFVFILRHPQNIIEEITISDSDSDKRAGTPTSASDKPKKPPLTGIARFRLRCWEVIYWFPKGFVDPCVFQRSRRKRENRRGRRTRKSRSLPTKLRTLLRNTKTRSSRRSVDCPPAGGDRAVGATLFGLLLSLLTVQSL